MIAMADEKNKSGIDVFIKEQDKNPVYYIIANGVNKFKAFGRCIGLEETVIKVIERDFPDSYEKTQQCIEEKIQRSEKTLGWSFWKEALVKLDEGTIIDEVERNYPYLSRKCSVGVHMYLHKGEKFAVCVHGAHRTIDFSILTYEKRQYIEYFTRAGLKTMVVREKPEDLDKNILDRHKIRLEYKLFCFSYNKEVENRVLYTIYEFFQNEIKEGKVIIVQGYDSKHHLKHSNFYYYQHSYKDSQIFIYLYFENYSIILLIDINPPIDVMEAIKDNKDNIRCLRTLHPCLNNDFVVYVPVSLFDGNRTAEFPTCCKDRGLIASKKVFEHITSFKSWFDSFLANLEDLDQSNFNENITDNLKKSIMKFMFLYAHFDGQDACDPRCNEKLEDNEEKLKMIFSR